MPRRWGENCSRAQAVQMPIEAGSPTRVLIAFHALAAAWLGAMLWYGSVDPGSYRALLQEDQIVEWTTFWLFLAAGVLGLRRSIRRRHIFDGLVALFCLVVAGEEISWGQRLLGYAAPEFFLRENFQQEVNLHNLPQSVQPGSFLMLALAGYGVVLPLVARLRTGRALGSRLGATPPPLALLPWYLAAIALLWWYPLTLTAEWIESLSGALFMASIGLPSIGLSTTLTATVAMGAATMAATGALDRGRDEERITCAREEVRNLAGDVAGEAGLSRLWQPRRVHKRLRSSIEEGYMDPTQLDGFQAALCAGSTTDSTRVRRMYGIDPWGSPYWVLVERESPDSRRLTVYSFGPNRRRDLTGDGDDIRNTGLKRPGPD